MSISLVASRFGKVTFTALAVGLILLSAGPKVQAASVSLGTAESFAVLGGSTVTNTGATILNGDLGVSPGTAITGFPPGIVNGTIAGTSVAAAAQADALAAYNQLAGLAVTGGSLMMDLGGVTLTPGVYNFSSSAQLTGALTLNGLGQADPLFVFQIGSTFTTASAASIVLFNGANAGNVFFQVGSSATLGTGTLFEGTIISNTSNTLNTGASVNGRVIALNGAVTLDGNTINVPDAPTVIPTPSAAAAGLFGLAMLASRRHRRHHTA